MPTTDLSALRIRRDEEPAGAPRRGRRFLIFALISLTLGAAVWGVWQGGWLPQAAPEVRVARPRVVQAGGAEEVLTATGYIVPQLQATVSARISGRLEWLGVEEGSVVTKDEVIARLTSDDLKAAVAEARASVAQARASLEQAKASRWQVERELERQRRLLDEGITTQSDHDLAKRAHDVEVAGVAAAEEAVLAARARLELNEANLEKTIVRAPFDGIVIAKRSEMGEMVAAGAFSGQPTGGAIVVIADFSTLEMEADINEAILSRVTTGQPALVAVDAVPDRRYRGVLRQIVPTADRQKAVVVVKVKLLEPDDRLVPDMSARVTFLAQEVAQEAASARPRLFVPASALRGTDDDTFVLAVREERIVRLPVAVGETRGDLKEVTRGLKGDESLVVAGGEGLSQGDRVRIAS